MSWSISIQRTPHDLFEAELDKKLEAEREMMERYNPGSYNQAVDAVEAVKWLVGESFSSEATREQFPFIGASLNGHVQLEGSTSGPSLSVSIFASNTGVQ